jgi:hypothetical protein
LGVVIFGIAVGIVSTELWLVVAVDLRPLGAALLVGLILGMMVGLSFGVLLEFLAGVLPGAWVPFMIGRSWLALRGRLPWRLMDFLADCHRLGQVGSVYQFRHARLQDHLARASTDLDDFVGFQANRTRTSKRTRARG